MALPIVLVDSGIWIDHISKGDEQLARLLRIRKVLLHPMIVAEVALGSLESRQTVIEELETLPQAPVANHTEVMAMIEWLKLFSTGIGYVDAHLLASVRQIGGCKLWTRDKRLRGQADRFEVAYTP